MQYPLTQEEKLIRQSVWNELSKFYLDTELDDMNYNYISITLKESKINLEELKAIDLYEVFPTLQLNLFSVAGVWDAFDPTWLNEKCLENYEKRFKSKLFRIYTEMKSKLHFSMRKKHWEEIEKRIKFDK